MNWVIWGHFVPENFLTLSILFRMSVLPRPVTSRLSHISRTPCSLLPPRRTSFWLVSFEIFFDFLVWSSSVGIAATGRFALATLDSLCLKAFETSHHSSGTSREYSKLAFKSSQFQTQRLRLIHVVPKPFYFWIQCRKESFCVGDDSFRHWFQR